MCGHANGWSVMLINPTRYISPRLFIRSERMIEEKDVRLILLYSLDCFVCPCTKHSGGFNWYVRRPKDAYPSLKPLQHGPLVANNQYLDFLIEYPHARPPPQTKLSLSF